MREQSSVNSVNIFCYCLFTAKTASWRRLAGSREQCEQIVKHLYGFKENKEADMCPRKPLILYWKQTTWKKLFTLFTAALKHRRTVYLPREQTLFTVREV